MGSKSQLVIGIPTAGRPTAISESLEAISTRVDNYDNIVVIDNTPEYNKDVNYNKFDADVIEVDETISPGGARQRIIEEVDSERLLLLDDDTIVQSGTVDSLMSTMDETGTSMVSGIWTFEGEVESGREVGSILTFAYEAQQILVQTPVYPRPLVRENINRVKLDTGLPTLLIDTDILDKISFDPRYDWFFEWIDFFTQTANTGLEVTVDLEASFSHKDFEYTGPTIRTEQDRQTDKARYEEKWNLQLNRNSKLEWAGYPSEQNTDTLRHQAARLYGNQGGVSMLKSAIEYFK